MDFYKKYKLKAVIAVFLVSILGATAATASKQALIEESDHDRREAGRKWEAEGPALARDLARGTTAPDTDQGSSRTPIPFTPVHPGIGEDGSAWNFAAVEARRRAATAALDKVGRE